MINLVLELSSEQLLLFCVVAFGCFFAGLAVATLFYDGRYGFLIRYYEGQFKLFKEEWKDVLCKNIIVEKEKK